MAALFDPITIRELTARNRIWVSPMCQYSVVERDGVPRDWHLAHLGSFAVGGAGIVFAEATAVNPEGRISYADTGIWSDEHAYAWRRIVAFVHAQGAAAGIQLAHAGRKGSTWPAWGADGRTGTVPLHAGGWRAVAPSAIAFPDPAFAVPDELDEAGIDAVVADFTAAARRSVEAGFDVIELHAAHGYLLHEFLSPLSNQRTDTYGGNLQNRARLLLRVVASVRAAIGDRMPLLVRFSATDYTDDGWDREQTATVAEWAKQAGADLFDISTGGNTTGVHIPVGPGYQVPFAEFVRRTAGVPVAAVGMIVEPEQADEIVRSGKADAVMLARELLRDPHFPLRAAHELGVELDYWPPQYERARWR